MNSQQPGSRSGATAPPGFYSRLVGFMLLLRALVNAGNMVSIDPKRRLQQSRSWWTSAPEVSAHGFGGGYPGKDGMPRTTFGMGHGLILTPADMAPLSDHVAEGAREVLVVFFSQAFICSVAALFAYLLLRRIGFPHAPSALGVLSLLLVTTFLHYMQNCRENNLMLACALAGAHFIVLWLRNERPRDAALARRGIRLCLADSSHDAGRHWRRDGLPVPLSAVDFGPDRRCRSTVAAFRPWLPACFGRLRLR